MSLRNMTDLDRRAAGGRRLKDKICIVTGAGQGIGRAAAKRLGAEGGTIVVADRVDEGATQTMAELGEHGVPALKVLVDLSSLTGAKELMSKVVAAYLRTDFLEERRPLMNLWATHCAMIGDCGIGNAKVAGECGRLRLDSVLLGGSDEKASNG